MIPEEIEETLKNLTLVPLSHSRQAADMCSKLLREGVGVEGEEFNRLTEVFDEEDSDEASGGAPPPEVKRRRRKALEESSKSAEPEQIAVDTNALPEPESDTIVRSFERVRYSSGIIGSAIAVPGYDPDYETFVRINKNHPFYQLVLNPLAPADRYRLALESLFFAAAVAENKTLQNIPAEIELEVIQKIFEKYRRVLSQNLEAWLIGRQELFG